MITVITGHYGSGKTTLAVNLAVKYAKEGKKTAIADLDIVNPFFRTADSEELFNELNIEMIAPFGANTNLETVYLPASVQKLFNASLGYESVLDIGGDDDGAIVLGRYAEQIKASGYKMLCVVSCYRPLTENPEDAAEMIKSIEKSSKLEISGIVNTSSLGEDTTAETILESLNYAKRVSELSGKKLVGTAVKKEIFKALTDEQKSIIGEIFPIEIYTKRFF